MKKITTALIITSLLMNTACTTIPEKQSTDLLNSRNTFVACRAADAASTALIIHAGGIELNPVMAAVIGHGWLVFAGVEGLIAVGAWYGWSKLSNNEKVLANVISCAPVINNAAVLLN